MLHSLTIRMLRAVTFTLALVTVVGIARAADWNLSSRRVDADTVEVSWKADSGERYQVCVKPYDAGGDVCDGDNSVHRSWVNAHPAGLFDRKTGRVTLPIDLPTCGINYKIRVKRSALAFDTGAFFQAC